jgi:hypothetical protein
MKRTTAVFILGLPVLFLLMMGQERTGVIPGADERSPSRSEYFSWINNTNEGATEAQTLVNLKFFRWLREEFGMALDIYAFDAGAIDGKRFYGSMDSERFRRQFPRGFGPIAKEALALGARLGIWGGPDGFGETPDEERARIEQMVGLCRDYEFALFKFDAVCGPLRPEKEDAFIRMMIECRLHSPDLILLNHRLGLERAQAHATTFLWEGKETYVDVFATNRTTAPHHRADALSRGLVPGLKRLTEDHGVCLSSALDYWEDDLVLQAFNRSLILAPQIYGNPWLLRDDEYPRLARIFNIHRRYRDILVQGMVLPETRFGPSAVSRGDGGTRLLTLRNLTWEPVTYSVPLDKTIGLEGGERIHCRQFHPTERIFGDFPSGAALEVEVPPFRSCLLLATSGVCDLPGVVGCDYEVVRDVPGRPVSIRLLGLPGTEARISLPPGGGGIQGAALGGRDAGALLHGESLTVRFPGDKLEAPYHRKLAALEPCEIPSDAESLYEATVFAADNNALELRSLGRSGPTRIPEVRAARDAFFEQSVFIERGISDRNLFDGDPGTGFWPSRKYNIDQRVGGGCLRLDLGEVTDIDQMVLRVPDEYSLQPLLREEGNFVEVSTDLRRWGQLTYLAGKKMVISFPGPVRFLRFRSSADRITEIEGYKDGRPLPREGWRASNLFAHPRALAPLRAWRARITLDEWVKGSVLCIAVEGEHGEEGAYAALKVGDRLVGCPDRAPSYPSNTWEYVNARRDRNYTYYAPVTRELIGESVEVYVLSYGKAEAELRPEVWITAYPPPSEGLDLVLERNTK